MARPLPTRSTSNSRADGDAAALINRVGALLLVAHDSMAEAAGRAVGRRAQALAALVALRKFLEDATIQQLGDVIGLTHSATVRLVNRLVADGYVLRQGSGRDGRTVAICLTKAGTDAAERVRQARRRAVEELLTALSDQERRALAPRSSSSWSASLAAGWSLGRVNRSEPDACNSSRGEHVLPLW